MLFKSKPASRPLSAVSANGFHLYTGRDFNHLVSYEELNFKCTTILLYEARKPCWRIGDVMPGHAFF